MLQIGSRSTVTFQAPSWASSLRNVPPERLQMGHFPTPLVRWNPFPDLPASKTREFFLKRDDLSGMELSGNKIRKLEFLLADAVASNADCIVTCGGLQSNHCRAVAVAARTLGLDSHLVLRIEDFAVKDAGSFCDKAGLEGNLLLNRMVGAKLHLCTKSEYARHGSTKLIDEVVQKLLKQGKRPYAIPVGGSNLLGTWGYIRGFEELLEQAKQQLDGKPFFSDIVIATGSAGSLAGISLANHLANTGTKVWAYGACDSPEWFHNFINKNILAEVLPENMMNLKSEELCKVYHARNLGYAISSEEELKSIREVALRTGVLFDPVYSGKAIHNFGRHLEDEPEKFGDRVLFWHTGGLFGLWDKQEQLKALLDANTIDGRPDVQPVFDSTLTSSAKL